MLRKVITSSITSIVAHDRDDFKPIDPLQTSLLLWYVHTGCFLHTKTFRGKQMLLIAQLAKGKHSMLQHFSY